MKLKYTRTFECEVPNDDIIAALQTKIDDWGNDCEGSMGIQDMLSELDSTGLLDEEITTDDGPEFLDGNETFCEAFYSVDSLQAELSSKEE